MAARRISQSNVNWSAIAERVHPSQRLNFNAFKSKSDKYVRSVMSNPETPPKINWEFYKSNIAIGGLVDTFQKSYEALKVPFPSDPLTSQVTAQESEVKKEIDSFKNESKKRIVDYQAKITHLKSLLPFDQMTMEDYRDAFPEQALDSINRPTFWPHTPEEQVDHKDDEHAAAAKH